MIHAMIISARAGRFCAVVILMMARGDSSAHAGSNTPKPIRSRPTWDHPRSREEHALHVVRNDTLDHPRSRGEHEPARNTTGGPFDYSARAGSTMRMLAAAVLTGGSFARAGSTLSACQAAAFSADHRRSRGGARHLLVRRRPSCGSSARAGEYLLALLPARQRRDHRRPARGARGEQRPDEAQYCSRTSGVGRQPAQGRLRGRAPAAVRPRPHRRRTGPPTPERSPRRRRDRGSTPTFSSFQRWPLPAPRRTRRRCRASG